MAAIQEYEESKLLDTGDQLTYPQLFILLLKKKATYKLTLTHLYILTHHMRCL